MKRLTFHSEHVYPTPRPQVPVTLHAPAGDRVVFALLDTGSMTSVFHMSVAGMLNIDDVRKGRKTSLWLPNNLALPAWAFPVEATILGHRIGFEIAFCPSFAAKMTNVIGMRGVFDQIVFGLEHAQRTVYA